MSGASAQLAAVRDAAVRRDREGVYRASHTLQGSAAMVGAESIARACAEIARMTRVGAIPDSSDPLMGIVGQRLRAVEAEHARFLVVVSTFSRT